MAGASGSRDVAVRYHDVSKHYGEVKAVDGLTLDVFDGEFFSLLGPSGSGKTTSLRLVGGFVVPTSGRVWIHGEDVTDQPTFARPVNTVFQDYALFPHMTVAANVGYGLMLKKVERSELTRRVGEALEMVHLPDVAQRRPHQLSGGQKQRVALARALVNRPKILLLDEPLGALDLKLRRAMQEELKSLQRQVGITFVYVTHDQEEALAMSDRIAIFNHGSVEQVGTPREVYEQPATAFVADFVGTSNRLTGALAERTAGEAGTYVIRPERLVLHIAEDAPGTEDGEVSLPGTVKEAAFLGMLSRFTVEVQPEVAMHIVVPNALPTSFDVGDRVVVRWRRADMRRISA